MHNSFFSCSDGEAHATTLGRILPLVDAHMDLDPRRARNPGGVAVLQIDVHRLSGARPEYWPNMEECAAPRTRHQERYSTPVVDLPMQEFLDDAVGGRLGAPNGLAGAGLLDDSILNSARRNWDWSVTAC